MFGIAVLGDADELRDEALQGLGRLRRVDSWRASFEGSEQVVLVDLRDGMPDSVGVPRSPTSLPVVGIVQQSQGVDTWSKEGHFDDLVSIEDLSSSAFTWRLERLIDRFQSRIAVENLNKPEVHLLQDIVNHLNDWVIIKDLQHRFVLVSDQFVAEVGLPREQIIGKDDLDIGTDPASVLGDPKSGYPGYWAQDDAVIASGKPVFEDNLDWRPFSDDPLSDDRRYKRTERVPLYNATGQIYALLVRTTDITGPVQAERNLEARNVMLLCVTEEKQRAEHHRQVAESAVKAKNTFLAAASHDLRQPLHALGLFLAVLDRRLRDPQNREILEKIQHSSDALSALFNSLLDISRLDAGVVDVQMQSFPIDQMLNNFRDEFGALGARKALRVSIDSSQQIIKSDPILFARILRNLLQNAVTHTVEGAITVMCSVLSNSLQIQITDTGPGIPLEEQEAIFTEFYQLESPGAGSTKGLGLGLAIVSRLADLLQVKVSLDSTVGKGTTFTVKVSLAEMTSLDMEDPEPDPDTLANVCVLVIDDEIDILDGLQRMLKTYQCPTLAAESAQQALEKLQQTHFVPDVMVVDYQLANRQFGDVAIDLICDHFKRRIPAIIVTGDTSAERLRDANRGGCLLLHKPVNPSDLVRSISEVQNLVMPMHPEKSH